MRAMILAAGLGTRMRPLSAFRAKPALPVRGVPVIARLLDLLADNGVDEVVINLHQLADSVRIAVDEWRPLGLNVHYSYEDELLGTGGGLLRAAEFLRGSDPAVVLAGDNLVDLDLASLAARHRERNDLATLVVRADPRMRQFGSIGFDREGRVRRVGKKFDLGGETDAGVFTSVRLFSPEVFDWMGERAGCFEDLRDVLVPALSRSSDRIRVECVAPDACAWEPVGTPLEYLHANFGESELVRSHDARALAAGVRISPALIVGAGAEVGPDCELERVVVWSNERVPAATRERNGVFANGGFHSCVAESAGAAA